MSDAKTVSSTPWWKYPLWLLLGLGFGAVLTKAQVISVVRVRRMFAFQEPHMFLVIGAAVVTKLPKPLAARLAAYGVERWGKGRAKT